MKSSVSPKACFLDSAISELYAHVSASRQIAPIDLEEIVTALSEYSITEEDRLLINRILYGIRRRWIKVVANNTNSLPMCSLPQLAVLNSQGSLNHKDKLSIAKISGTPVLA